MRASWIGKLSCDLISEITDNECKYNPTRLGYAALSYRTDELSLDLTGNIDSSVDVGKYQQTKELSDESKR